MTLRLTTARPGHDFGRNSETPGDKRVIFGIGIDVSDIMIDGDHIFDGGVNIAANSSPQFPGWQASEIPAPTASAR